MDFAILPPEINSGRMYIGPGPGPTLAAATAWDDLAAELGSTAASYTSEVSALTSGAWQGPSSASMAAAAEPYVAWMNATAARLRETGSQAKVAAAASRPRSRRRFPRGDRGQPRAVDDADRHQHPRAEHPGDRCHRSPLHGNVGPGRHRDVCLCGSSAGASQLTPFSEPPPTTNDAGTAAQSAAATQATSTSASNIGTQLTQFINSLPTALQNLANGLTESPTTASATYCRGCPCRT